MEPVFTTIAGSWLEQTLAVAFGVTLLNAGEPLGEKPQVALCPLLAFSQSSMVSKVMWPRNPNALLDTQPRVGSFQINK